MGSRILKPGRVAGFGLFFFIASSIMIGLWPLTTEKAIGPFDLLITRPLYTPNGVSSGNARFSERSDYLDAYRPRWTYFRKKIQEGDYQDLDTNPLRGFGEKGIQLLSNNFWTLRTQVYVWAGDPVLGHNLGHLLQLAIGGVGAFVLFSSLGFALPWAALGGFFFGWNGFLSSWFYWSQFTTAVWMPWVFWALLKLQRNPCSKTAGVFLLSILGLIAGGFPSVMAYIMGFCLIVALIDSVRLRNLTRLGFFVAALLLALLLMSPFLYQFFDLLKEVDTSYRVNARGAEVKNLIRYLKPFEWGAKVEVTGYVGLLPLVGMLSLLVFGQGRELLFGRTKGANKSTVLESPLFWLIMTLLYGIAAFDYPKFLSNIAYSLPVIGSNPSNRMISVIALLLSGLGLWGLRFFWIRIKLPSWGTSHLFGAIFFLVLFHTLDMSQIWRKQNTVRPRVEFFGVSPALELMMKDRRYGDAVLADTSVAFLPGTLTNYGFKEWHAHGFKTPKQKELLAKLTSGKSPWVTQTNAILKAEDFPDLSDQAYKFFQIKYLVVPATSKFKPNVDWGLFYKNSELLILKRLSQYTTR